MGTAEEHWSAIEAHLEQLDGVRLHLDRRGRRWCVDNRLVARQLDASTLLIRSDFREREDLLDAHPSTFSVRPQLEGHMKVLADVIHGEVDAICDALTAARDLQRA